MFRSRIFHVGKAAVREVKCLSTQALVASSKPLPLHYLTEDEAATKEAVGKFSREKISPLVSKMEQDGKLDPGLVQSLFEQGLLGIEVPVQYGGSGLNFMNTILAVEEIGKVDTAVTVVVAVHNSLVCGLIMKLGTPEQKEKYLPQLAQQKVGSFCLSESSSGSDAFAMKTTAKQDGDHFIINGSKMWISNSDIADVFVVFVNAEPSKGYRGITAFILERDTEGLTIGKPEKKLGIKASGTCQLHFDNVRVHKSAVLGELYHGYKYAAGFLNESRIAVASQMLGLAQGCYDITIPYTLQRKQFGKQIYDFQAVQHQIASIAVRLECARLLVYNAVRLVEAGQPFAKQASMAKYHCAELAQDVARNCIDWMGGVGFTTDFPQEKFYRDSKVGSIYEGTGNIQLSTIAKHIRTEFST